MRLKTFNFRKRSQQMELGIRRELERDRNYQQGGRSFYFFDFDDNIAILGTPVFIFHKTNHHEIRLSSKDFAMISRSVGVRGEYKDYEVRIDDESGSFRAFRDQDQNLFHRLVGKKQNFIEDLLDAMALPDYQWKGPAWDCFYHAVFNRRPISLITARGHHPLTLMSGIDEMIRLGHLPHSPNYLSLYPINHPETRNGLTKDKGLSVAELKRSAIRASVEEAIRIYGYSPHHRFGMSDDDGRNIELIMQEMSELKRDYPEMSFFVFDTNNGQVLKREVFPDHTEDQPLEKPAQLSLF